MARGGYGEEQGTTGSIGAVNESFLRLGLAGTVITASERTIVNSTGRDAGFTDRDQVADEYLRWHFRLAVGQLE